MFLIVPIFPKGSHTHSCFKTAQFAIAKIETWCNGKSFRVNLDKAEGLLDTSNGKLMMPSLSIFGKSMGGLNRDKTIPQPPR